MERFEIFESLAQFFKAIGFQLVLFCGGLFGAFVNVSKNKRLTTIERVTTIVSGGIIANYLTPLVIELLSLKQTSSYAAAFILGYVGLKSVEIIIEFLENKFFKGKNNKI